MVGVGGGGVRRRVVQKKRLLQCLVQQSLEKICFVAISNFLKGSNNAEKSFADVLDT